jgi:hypothetical protein
MSRVAGIIGVIGTSPEAFAGRSCAIAVGSSIRHIKLCDHSATTRLPLAGMVVFALKSERRSRPKACCGAKSTALIRFV